MNDGPSHQAAPSTPWSDALDQIVAGLEALEAASVDDVEAAPPELPVWEPPQDLGPIPEELRPRATKLLAALKVAMGRGDARRAQVLAELQDLDRRRQAGTAYQQPSSSVG